MIAPASEQPKRAPKGGITIAGVFYKGGAFLPANGSNGNNGGGLGGIAASGDQVRDTRMLQRAVENRWNIPDEYKEGIVKRQVKIAIDPETQPREASAAARTIVAMEAQNQADEHKLIADKVDTTITGGGVVLYIPDNGRE